MVSLRSTLLIATSLVAFVAAEYNSIVAPGKNAVIQGGGGTYTVAWNNLTGSKVSLSLLRGGNGDLTTVADIASGIDNSGSYLWEIDTSYPAADNYVMLLTYDGGSTYSSYFTIQLCSTCTAVSNTASPTDVVSTSIAAAQIGTRSESPATSAPDASSKVQISTDTDIMSSTATGGSTTAAGGSSARTSMASSSGMNSVSGGTSTVGAQSTSKTSSASKQTASSTSGSSSSSSSPSPAPANAGSTLIAQSGLVLASIMALVFALQQFA